MKKAVLASVVALALFLSACNGPTAATTQRVISAIIATLQAEIPEFPVSEQSTVTGFVSLGQSLNAQLGSCIANISNVMGTKAKFGSCFLVFAQGLLNPSELSQLRILSAKSQGKAQLIVTGIVAAVNIWIAFDTPAVGPAPTASELRDFKAQVLQGMK